MYGEKLHSYGVTAKCGGAKAPLAPLFRRLCLKAFANHMKGVQVMATIILQCNHFSQCLLQAEISMIGRAYMGEVLTQIWLKSITK